MRILFASNRTILAQNLKILKPYRNLFTWTPSSSSVRQPPRFLCATRPREAPLLHVVTVSRSHRAVAPLRRDPIWANATAAVPLPNGTCALSSGLRRVGPTKEITVTLTSKNKAYSFTLMRDPLHVTLSRGDRCCMGTAGWDTPRSRRSHVSLIAGVARDIFKYLLRLSPSSSRLESAVVFATFFVFF